MMSLYLDARYPGPAVELERSVVLRGDDARSAASGSCVGDILKIDALPAFLNRSGRARADRHDLKAFAEVQVDDTPDVLA
jgi:hypothetical protein